MESVVLETSLGDIQLELYWDHAPKVSILYHSAEKLTRTLRRIVRIDLQELC